MKCDHDDYCSPSFYAFSEDSITLSKVAIADCEKNQKHGLVLDLGAGCGVVGIEFVKGAKDSSLWRLTCCEKQNEFAPYLKKNLSSHKIIAEYQFTSFQNFSSKVLYDVILFNPPYFDEKKGRSVKDLNRHSCRFFSKDFFSDLVLFINEKLAVNGYFYFLYRSDQVTIDHYFQKNKYQVSHLAQLSKSLSLIRVLKL